MLLEPLEDPAGGLPVRVAAWRLRIFGWEAAWDGCLHDALAVEEGEGSRFAVGTLSHDSLLGWIASLEGSPIRFLATAIQATMDAHLHPERELSWGSGGSLSLQFPVIMGIVNVTPDSFSDGGRFAGVAEAVAHGERLAAAGAGILDVGGESTRPGAEPVAEGVEMERVVPVIRELARRVRVPISVDSAKGAVMEAALDAGAAMVNDVTALRGDGTAAARLAARDCPVILMHMQGAPRTMQEDPRYGHVLSEVYDFLARRVEYGVGQGIARRRFLVDPGIGFGKLLCHNLSLLRHMRAFCGLGVPVVLGASRKRVIGEVTGEAEPALRDPGSVVAAVMGALKGASILRVHDVASTRQALSVAWALSEVDW